MIRRLALLDTDDVRDAVHAVLDSRGQTVRCTPWRRTIQRRLPGGATVYRKVHHGRRAEVEWRWLGELDRRGFRVPARAYCARARGLSVVAFAAVPGRGVDGLWAEAIAGGEELGEVRGFVVDVVAPMVRRLHDAGLVYRDLYWNHLFAERLSPAMGEPHLIDVERVMRPRWRRRRWLIKDLAGLVSSAPAGVSPTWGLRFLRAYDGGTLRAQWKALARAVLAKAERIAGHQPKYG